MPICFHWKEINSSPPYGDSPGDLAPATRCVSAVGAPTPSAAIPFHRAALPYVYGRLLMIAAPLLIHDVRLGIAWAGKICQGPRFFPRLNFSGGNAHNGVMKIRIIGAGAV